MKFYGKENVFDAALNRIRYLFDEFPNVIVSVSGGKDSTVIFHLALQVAREKNRLPLRVMFLDQEAEWQATIDQIRSIMQHPDVEPFWYQIPLRLFNATSTVEHWLMCWDPAEEARWMRPKESYSIKANTYGTDRFGELFNAVIAKDQQGPTANIGGVRTEESPARFVGLTTQATHKWITWGKVLTKRLDHYTFYPIYDWSYSDIWKAIHSNGWPYNAVYDAMYSYGVPVLDMRVSNVHHETAVQHLFRMQEIEPDTYERLTQRIAGIDMAGKMGEADYFVKDLPFMFQSWREYRDFLLDKLITNPDWHAGFRRIFKRHEDLFLDVIGDRLFKVHISSILTNDWEHVKLRNFEGRRDINDIRRAKKALA